MEVSTGIGNPRHHETIVVARMPELVEDSVTAAQAEGVELVVIRHADAITVFEGRCPHQGTLLSEGSIRDGVLTCRGHGWQFECGSGCTQGHGGMRLQKFGTLLDGADVRVDRDELLKWKATHASAGTPPPTAPHAVRSLEQLPGPKGIPLLGNLLQLHPTKLHLTLEEWCREFGPIYTYKLMHRPFVVIADPELVNQILRDRPKTYRRWNAIENISKEVGMNGVFSAEGDAWRRQRSLVAQALNPAHLRSFFPTMCKVTARLKARLDKAAREHRTVDIQKDLMRYTVDVTTNIALGYDMNTLECEGDVIQRHLEWMFPMLNRRINSPFPYWHYFKLSDDRELDRAVKALREIVGGFISDSRARMARSHELALRPANFLEALIVAQEDGVAPLTDDEVFANVFTILLAGEDTTANTIAWMTDFMCRYPAVQRRMQDEVDSLLGQAAFVEEFGDTDRLAFLDAVANETMRLKPVAPLLALEGNRDVMIGDVEVPVGTVIMLLMRHSALVDASAAAAGGDSFAPERWLSGDDAAARHRAGFVPFGSGPRLCPGRSLALLEIRSAVAMICRNFHLSESAGASPVEEVFSFSMMPRNLRVDFTARH
ncbi:Cytochrome P450 [Paraburkholderia fungorum]|uniref:Cytochrome P450 n=1 Tax=Paraburkholderia fungorum TaxID=134537 RepID=A0A1H1IQ49_9BURK|nr:cytochrome P450 [Paraburkholderia fungorum]SDR39807.1 Cytochrome P450 [Paraburkholderia fungorum]